jgi:hypothetical protein
MELVEGGDERSKTEHCAPVGACGEREVSQ